MYYQVAEDMGVDVPFPTLMFSIDVPLQMFHIMVASLKCMIGLYAGGDDSVPYCLFATLLKASNDSKKPQLR